MNQKKKFRKSLVIILTMILMMQLGVYANTANADYSVISAIESNGNIYEGDSILLKLTVDNINANPATDYTAVKVYISGDFSVASGSYFLLGDITNAAVPQLVSIPVVYDGSGNKLNVLIDDGAGHSIIENITVANVVETNTSVPTPVDKDRLYPEFNLLLKDAVPVFYAGQKKEFEFELENRTTHYGKDVQVELVNNSSEYPFDDRINRLITTAEIFNSKEKKTLKINVETLANVPSGFYTLPVKITFKNVYGLEQSQTKNIQIEVISRQKVPTFVLHEFKKSEDLLIPGQNYMVQFTLKNLGTLDAKNMRITLEGLNVNGITLDSDVATKSIVRFAAGSTDFVTYSININKALAVDRQEMFLNLSYVDQYGETYTEKLPVYIDIEQTKMSLYDFDVKVTSVPTAVQPGQEFNVKFDVTNKSGYDQENIKLSIKSDGGFIFKSQPVVMIKNIKKDEKQSFVYTLIADENMTSNNYPTYITLEGKAGSEPLVTYLGVFVDGETATSSKPKIIVDQYVFGKENILAGETFDLEITFFNTSNTMGIQNAKVSISSEEGAFVPVNAASSFYIDKIGIKEKVVHVITMKAKTDLNIKTYNVTALIEYEDSNGNSYDKNNNPYTATENMAIPVMQELRLEVEELSVDQFGFVYQPMNLFVEFFNMGKAPLSNMLVRTEGDFEVQDGKYFVGNFAAGTNDYYECTIIPMMPGVTTGKVIFEFEDAVGEKYTVEKEFTIEAMEMQENFDEYPGGYEEFPLEDPSETKSFPWNIIVIAFVIISAVAGLVIIRLRIKKKKEMKLDE